MTEATTAAELDAMAEAEIAAFEAGQSTQTQEPESAGQTTEPAAGEQPAAEQQATEQAPTDEQAGEQSNEKPAETEQPGAASDELDAEALAEIANGGAPAADPLQLLQFKAEAPADFDAQKAALRTERATALGKMMQGEISAEDYAEIDNRVSDHLDALNAARIRAETLIEATGQVQAKSQAQVINALVASAKRDGIDYGTDLDAVAEFDAALAAVQASPRTATKSFAEQAAAAHRIVALSRAADKPQQTQQPAASAKAPERKPPAAPVTLSGLPNAGTATERTVEQVLEGLTGPEFEAAFDALPAEKQRAFLKQQQR